MKRKYAFELTDVPRDETAYLKFKYSAEHGFPPSDKCDSGGRYYERIFGGRTPPLESFLIKRKLMGPAWLRIREPQKCAGSVTHCKFECSVESAKLVGRLDAPPGRAPPFHYVPGPQDRRQSQESHP